MAASGIFGPVSLADVARHAGVSTATVSRVLNGTAIVSEEKRQAVEYACDALGYVPNGAARALSSRRSLAIGAVVPTIETETFARMLSAFQKTLHQAGYTLLLTSSGFDPAVELKEVMTLLKHGIDALMVVGNTHHPKMWEWIDSKKIACVQAWSLESSRPSVGFDNFAVASEIAELLLSLGHRRIGMIAGTPPTNDRGYDRILGTRSSLRQAGIDLADEYLITNAFSLDEGRLCMQRLLTLSPRPTAVICGNDVLAFGAMLTCIEQGLGVPRDISIVGFNDFHYAMHLDPALTTMRVDLEAMGEAAAQCLLNQLNRTEAALHTVIKPELIVRASTGPAPTGP